MFLFVETTPEGGEKQKEHRLPRGRCVWDVRSDEDDDGDEDDGDSRKRQGAASDAAETPTGHYENVTLCSSRPK